MLYHRYGLLTLKLYQIKELGFIIKQTINTLTINNSKWVYNLEKLFKFLIINKIYILKNMDIILYKTII